MCPQEKQYIVEYIYIYMYIYIYIYIYIYSFMHEEESLRHPVLVPEWQNDEMSGCFNSCLRKTNNHIEEI
jgi:hypothetical protein